MYIYFQYPTFYVLIYQYLTHFSISHSFLDQHISYIILQYHIRPSHAPDLTAYSYRGPPHASRLTQDLTLTLTGNITYFQLLAITITYVLADSLMSLFKISSQNIWAKYLSMFIILLISNHHIHSPQALSPLSLHTHIQSLRHVLFSCNEIETLYRQSKQLHSLHI